MVVRRYGPGVGHADFASKQGPFTFDAIFRAVVVRFGQVQVCHPCTDTPGDVFSRFHPSGGLISVNLAPKTVKLNVNGAQSATVGLFSLF